MNYSNKEETTSLIVIEDKYNKIMRYLKNEEQKPDSYFKFYIKRNKLNIIHRNKFFDTLYELD